MAPSRRRVEVVGEGPAPDLDWMAASLPDRILVWDGDPAETWVLTRVE